MLTWVIVFAGLSVVAGCLGFTGVAGVASVAARVTFGVLLIALAATIAVATCQVAC